MNTAKATAEYTVGLQNIERDIIDKVRAAGGTITAKNFKWNQGKGWVPPPKGVIEIEIGVQGKSFVAHLSYEQVVDSSKAVVRPDVVAGVRNAVDALKP
jgi:hypothetical protein